MQNKSNKSIKQWIDIDKSEFKKCATELLGIKNGKYQNKTLARDTLAKFGYPTDDHNLLESARFFIIYHKQNMLEELELGNHPLLEEETKKLGIPTDKV